jgi:hypothetical protein
MKKLEYKNGFCIYGDIVSQNEAGVWFKSSKETSFINFSEIKLIRECY